MTGNIIVSTCCLGDMAVNAPSSSGCALGHGGRLQPYHPRKHELTITNPTRYISRSSIKYPPLKVPLPLSHILPLPPTYPCGAAVGRFFVAVLCWVGAGSDLPHNEMLSMHVSYWGRAAAFL